MQLQQNVNLGGVLVDIEYESDRDIETGEWFFVEHGKVTAGGVDISDALYLMGDSREVEKKIFDALRYAIKFDEAGGKQARRARLLNSAMCGDVLEQLQKLSVAA
jgi:hypothetical protein